MSLSGLFIEPRKMEQIILNMYNFQKCLPNTMLYFYCGKNNKEYYENEIIEFNNLNQNKVIDICYITIIELDTNNLTFITYSNLLKKRTIWETINTDYIITIQTDGCLCENTKHKISNFFKYDYVGGYAKQKWWWKETKNLYNYNCHQCFNGGFSLRNRRKILSVINAFPSNTTKKFYHGCPMINYPEDLYFVTGLLKLKYKVGLDNFATMFCSHTSFVPGSFCIHKLDHYVKKDELIKCLNYCDFYSNFLVKHKL
jgi:hypothetical protein